jgi:hypothetical protein
MTLTLTDQTSAPAAPAPRPARARATAERSRRLPRPLHRAVLATHVLSSVGWFGVAVTVAFAAAVGSTSDELAVYELIRSSLWLTVPLGLTSAATGIVLSLTTRWGLVRHWWVVAKEAITLAAIVTDVLVVAPAMARAVDGGTPVGIPGPVYAHVAVLGIATVLSVVKPRARTPLGARS